MPKPKKTKGEYITVEVRDRVNFMLNSTHTSLEDAEREVREERNHSGSRLKIFKRVPQDGSGRARRS